jgi:hypothetical protein
MIRIRVRQVGHALHFDQITSPRQQLHQPCDDLVEQALEFIVGGGTRLIPLRPENRPFPKSKNKIFILC